MAATFVTAHLHPRFKANISSFCPPTSRRVRPWPSIKCLRERQLKYLSSLADAQHSEGIRINKCFKSFASRRESDLLVERGRVTVNGEIATPGSRVFPGDLVQLDGNTVQWERLTVDVNKDTFTYVKHWKQTGIICTTDDSIHNNIVRQVPQSFKVKDRLFPVGRLDEASTGLILLTSDGRLPNAILGAGKDCAKEYIVTPDMYLSNEDIQKLREGVVITTVAQRDRNIRKPLTAPTLPCEVERRQGRNIMIRLQEGRNRQIRKMLGALGYTTRFIHRTWFMGINLSSLSGPGDTQALNKEELAIVEAKLRQGR